MVFEQLFGQSIGKMITRTVVLNGDGERPGFGQIIVRNLARLIPFEAFSFLTKNPTGWHDSLSKTMVVNKNQLNKFQKKNGRTKTSKRIPIATVAFILIPVAIFALPKYFEWRLMKNVDPENEVLKMINSDSSNDSKEATLPDNRKIDILLPYGWEKQETTGKNMVLSATDGESIVTIHKIEIDESVSFQDLNSEEKTIYADQIFKEAKNTFEGVELIDSGFKQTVFYDEVFFIAYERTIGDSETVNLIYQIFDGDLYTLTTITSESSFGENRQQLERILDSFKLM